jgi:1-phosphofructokinase family hexose kinase
VARFRLYSLARIKARCGMILCLGTTPALQRVMVFRTLAMGEVNRAHTTLEGAAGKSVNTAKILRALGERVIATGFLGGLRGDRVRALLTSTGVELDFVSVASPTRQCVTLIDESAGTVTELVEESQPVQAADYERLLEVVQRHLPASDALVCSGTIASGGPVDLYAQCLRLRPSAGTLAVVDATGAALTATLPWAPDVVKPNLKELESTVGRSLSDEASRLAAMAELQARGARRVVVTAGAEPTLALEGHAAWRITGTRVHAVNPIGSGDSATAALTWRLLQGDNLGEACRWAAAAGAANALTVMAGELALEDLHRLAAAVQVERLG